MTMQVSIAFDPFADSQVSVTKLVAAAFAAAGQNFTAAEHLESQIITTANAANAALTTEQRVVLEQQAAQFRSMEANGAALHPGQTAIIAAAAAAATQPLPTDVNPAAAALLTAAPGATPGNVASPVDVDSTGVPWDSRIHSSGLDAATGKPKKSSKGVWNKRKGVQELDYNRIHNELLTTMAATANPAAMGLPAGGIVGNPANVPHQTAVEIAPGQYVVAPLTPNSIAPLTPAPMGTVPPASLESPLTPPPMALTPAPLAAPAKPANFNELIAWVTSVLAPAGKLTQDTVQLVCAHAGLVDANGVGTLQNAAARPDLIAWLHENLTNQMNAVA